MIPFEITVKNYRCFSDNKPLKLRFAGDVVAFIGKNNSGKSSVLKFFFEFRNLWQMLSNISQIDQLVRGGIGLNLNNVQDYEEIFCNTNTKDIIIEIVFERPDSNTTYIERIVLSIPRKSGAVEHITLVTNTGDKWPNVLQHQIKYSEPFFTCDNSSNVYGRHLIDTFANLAKLLYFGAFRNAINQGAGNEYDLAIGSGFINLWDSWKAGLGKAAANKTIELTETLESIFGYRPIEINAAANNQTLNIRIGRYSYRLDELGSGITQAILLLANAAIKQPSYIFIDEPELNLHPVLQQKLLEQLLVYSLNGVVFATHSIGLARTCANRIYAFEEVDGYSVMRPYEALVNLTEFLGEINFSAFREIGYDKILLVEGIHDVKVYKHFLSMMNPDHNCVILQLGGDQRARGGLQVELEEIKRLCDKIYAIVDSEKTARDAAPVQKRLDFKADCESVGIKIHLTELRAIENYFPAKSIEGVFGDRYKSLGPYEKFGATKQGWNKHDNWRVAHRMTLADLENTDIGKFLRDILVRH